MQQELRQDYLDGWRGLAICLLLFGHFLPVPGIPLGTVGVNMFFVLSGLLMARLLFIRETPLRLFYKRRLSRIFPAHLFFIAAVTSFHLASDIPVNWNEVGMATLFINNYFPGNLGSTSMPFGHIWSLSVEEHSYIVLASIALLCRQTGMKARYWLALLATSSAAMGFYYAHRYSGVVLDFGKWIHTEVSIFGIAVSALMTIAWQIRRAPGLCGIPCLILLAVLLHWWSVPNPVRTVIGVGCFALAVNWLHLAPLWQRKLLSLPVLRQLGLWSFSIYLWQQPFYLAVHRGTLSAWQGLALSIIAGLASYYLIERPTRTALNRSWAKA